MVFWQWIIKIRIVADCNYGITLDSTMRRGLNGVFRRNTSAVFS